MAKTENGKGGNFDTRKNPFTAKTVRKGGAPDIASAIGLGPALDALLKAGCAFMVGRTRDEGALVLTVLDQDDRHRTYCSTEEELDEAITALSMMYGG
jgi:hypothetical protein